MSVDDISGRNMDNYKEIDGKKIYRCETYSRVVGYLSPVSIWNKGKKEEFEQRQNYEIPRVKN